MMIISVEFARFKKNCLDKINVQISLFKFNFSFLLQNDYQYQLLRCVDALILIVKEDCSEIGNQLFLVVATVKALSQGALAEFSQSRL